MAYFDLLEDTKRSLIAARKAQTHKETIKSTEFLTFPLRSVIVGESAMAEVGLFRHLPASQNNRVKRGQDRTRLPLSFPKIRNRVRRRQTCVRTHPGNRRGAGSRYSTTMPCWAGRNSKMDTFTWSTFFWHSIGEHLSAHAMSKYQRGEVSGTAKTADGVTFDVQFGVDSHDHLEVWCDNINGNPVPNIIEIYDDGDDCVRAWLDRSHETSVWGLNIDDTENEPERELARLIIERVPELGPKIVDAMMSSFVRTDNAAAQKEDAA